MLSFKFVAQHTNCSHNLLAITTNFTFSILTNFTSYKKVDHFPIITIDKTFGPFIEEMWLCTFCVVLRISQFCLFIVVVQLLFTFDRPLCERTVGPDMTAKTKECAWERSGTLDDPIFESDWEWLNWLNVEKVGSDLSWMFTNTDGVAIVSYGLWY